MMYFSMKLRNMTKDKVIHFVKLFCWAGKVSNVAKEAPRLIHGVCTQKDVG